MYSVLLTALLAAALQIINSIGALTPMNAFRCGRALMMSPLAFPATTPFAIGTEEGEPEPV